MLGSHNYGDNTGLEVILDGIGKSVDSVSDSSDCDANKWPKVRAAISFIDARSFFIQIFWYLNCFFENLQCFPIYLTFLK